MKKSLKAGFSLVELMVVVAIIGVLATIAIPNFIKMQAKAKQSNAKSELSGIYSYEKTFFTEYSQYHTNLAFVGYVPDGIQLDTASGKEGCPKKIPDGVIRHYRTGFTDDGGSNVATGDAVAGVKSKCGLSYGPMLAYYDGTTPQTNSTVTTLAGWASGLSKVMDPSNYTAAAVGVISNAGISDIWTINQDRSMLNVSVGY